MARKKQILELDLHGYKHIEVEDAVERFILNNNLPVRIITGKSEKMRKLVLEVLDYYEFEYYTPFHNSGEIIVVE